MTYTTATLVEQEIRATLTFDTSTTPTLAAVTTWIDEATNYIDEKTNFAYTLTTFTDYHTPDLTKTMYLKHSPLSVINSLSYNTTPNGYAPTWESRTEYTHFISDPDLSSVTFTNAFNPLPTHTRGVRVVYQAGYDAVPSRIQTWATKLVADRVITTLVNNNVNERNAGGSISVGSINIVEPSDYGVGSWKALKKDLKDFEDSMTGDNFRVHRYG